MKVKNLKGLILKLKKKIMEIYLGNIKLKIIKILYTLNNNQKNLKVNII